MGMHVLLCIWLLRYLVVLPGSMRLPCQLLSEIGYESPHKPSGSIPFHMSPHRLFCLMAPLLNINPNQLNQLTSCTLNTTFGSCVSSSVCGSIPHGCWPVCPPDHTPRTILLWTHPSYDSLVDTHTRTILVDTHTRTVLLWTHTPCTAGPLTSCFLSCCLPPPLSQK